MLKLTILVAHIIVILALSALMGCEGQPLDVLLDQSGKHSTDIVSEISGCYTGLDIDAEAGEYLAIFSKTCVDNVLGVEVSDPEGVELSDIVVDVAINKETSTYTGQTVTIEAVPWINYSHIEPVNLRFNAVGIHTQHADVAFIVQDSEGENDLADIDTGATYNLTVLITNISESTSSPGNYTIFANIVESPTKADIEIQDVTVAAIVSDVATGGTQYLKSTVRINAQVWLDTITLGNNQGIVLLTDNDNVIFYVIDPDVSDNLTQYAANSTYEFVLFVGSISQDDDGFTISANMITD